MSGQLSPIEVEQEIMRVSGLLDHQVGEVARRAKAAATAEVAWKIGHAKALLRTQGSTVAEREAKALLECEAEFDAHKHADAVLLAAQEAGRSLRARIDALRTLAANLRAAIAHSEGMGG